MKQRSKLTLPILILAQLCACRALAGGGIPVAWGSGSSGQTIVPQELTNVILVASGLGHNLALKDDGTVRGWGFNSHGQADAPRTQ